jgi:hypothetical protein
MATGKPYLGLAVKSRATGQPTIPYTVPILNDTGEVSGILVGGISLTVLADAIVQITISPDARASLNDLRNKGVIIAHKNPQRILTPISGKNEAVRLTMAGNRGAIETESSDGELNLVAYTPVPDRTPGQIVLGVGISGGQRRRGDPPGSRPSGQSGPGYLFAAP